MNRTLQNTQNSSERLRIAGPVAIGMSEVLWLLWWLWAHVRHAVRR